MRRRYAPTKSRSCEGKKAHPTRGAAETHRRRLIRDYGAWPGSMRVYRCDSCRAWHVGHVVRRDR